MQLTIHQLANDKACFLPANISLAWFLACAKSLPSPTLAEVSMQANFAIGFFKDEGGNF